MRQSSGMKSSSSTEKPGEDHHAENVFRRPRRNPKNSNSVLNDKSLRPRGKIIISKAAKTLYIPKYRNRLSSIVTQKLIRANEVQEVGSESSVKQSSFLRGQQKGANSLVNGNTSANYADRKSKISCSSGVQAKRKTIKGRKTDEISESSLSESPGKSTRKSVGYDTSRRPINYNLLSFSSDNEADQSSDASEPDYAKCNFSQRKDTKDEKLFKSNSLTSRQPVEEKIVELETPNESLDSYHSLEYLPDGTAFDKEDLNVNYDTVEELVDIINTFENFNIVLPKKTFVYQALIKGSNSLKNEKESSDENKNNLENIVTAKLMGDIDLHLELENYLKAISTSDETGSCKVRTKNTIQQNRVNCARGENTDFEGSNVIDNKSGITVSSGELNSLEYSENRNENEKFKKEDSVLERFFNEAKAKSSSSFKSAVSACTPPSPRRDKNLENQFFVFLDKKIENFPMSQEEMDLKPTKDCASYTFSQVLEESKNVKKIRSENDTSLQQLEIKSRGHIKRTVGELSFHPPQRDTPPPIRQSVKLQYSLPNYLPKDTQEEPQTNLYEKISPFEQYYEGKLKPNTKSSVLFKNSLYSTSADSLKPNAINIECDSVQLCTDFLPVRASSKYQFGNRVEEQEQNESVLSETEIIDNMESPDGPIKSQLSLIAVNSKTENWSPSLQELTEIYNSVLKQNKKIRRCNIKRVKRCISNYIISFIHDKIKEKMHKKDLINYAKERIGDPKLRIEKISNIYAGESKNCEKKNFSQLVEYVNRFQEVLTSSLSINQITRLNNIMASLQDSSLENLIQTKPANKTKTKKVKSVMSEKGSLRSFRSSTASSLSKQKTFKSDGGVKKIKDVRETISFRTNNLPKRNAFKTTAKDNLKSVKEVELPPSADLESVLKLYLTNSGKIVGENSDPTPNAIGSCERKKNKFLVNVKLCQNKIIVNEMLQFKSEKALSKPPLPSKKETSDLIIESISNKKVEKLKCSSKEKSSKSINLNKSIKKKIKKPEVKTSKQETHPFKTGDKRTKRKSEESVSEEEIGKTSRESSPHVLIREIGFSQGIQSFQDEETFIHKFEYDHHQLKIQHPMEAIIESSESRISERTVENYNELLLGQEESKFHVEGEMVKDRNYVLCDKDLNVLTKSSIMSNVGSGEKPSRPSQQTYLTESPKKKNTTLFGLDRKFSRMKTANFRKPIDALNSASLQSSKKTAPKKKKLKILSSRPQSTYLCYPYFQCIQSDKTTIGKKGGKNIGSASSSHHETVSKMDPSRKGQNKTKVLKGISKGLSNLFKKTSERKEVPSKVPKSNSKPKPKPKPVLEKKQENSKTSEDCQVSNSKVEEDDQSKESIFFSTNDNGSTTIMQNRSFVSLTNSERSAQEPINLESSKHSTSGNCSSRLENPEANCSENCIYGVQENDECNSACVKGSFTSQNSSGTADSHRRPTVVIHARKEVSRTKIKSLFKSHSDMKFFPGRVVDNPEEQTPFVTFVLTPKQKEEAGIPDYLTKVVSKPKASEENLRKDFKEDDFHVNFGQITHENSLKAIELFIKTLSESRKKACKLKAQDNKTEKTSQNVPKELYVSASKPCPNKYKFTPCRRLQALFASKRKPYHECQKRLLSNKIENPKKETSKKNPFPKKNSKLADTIKVTQMSSGNTNQSQKNELENPRKSKSLKNTEMMTGEAQEAKTVEDNLTLTTKSCHCVSHTEPNTDANTPNDDQNEVNLLPGYVNGAESLKIEINVVEAETPSDDEDDETEDETVILSNDTDATERNQRRCKSAHDSERKMPITKNVRKISSVGNFRNCKSVDSSAKQMKGTNDNKQLKLIKIIIHSTQSNSNIPEMVEENTYPSFVEGIESLRNPTPETSVEISDDERELLDSLLLKEENLERKSSTYFDAEENECEEKSDKTEGLFQVSFNCNLPNSWSIPHRSYLHSPNTRVGNLRPISG